MLQKKPAQSWVEQLWPFHLPVMSSFTATLSYLIIRKVSSGSMKILIAFRSTSRSTSRVVAKRDKTEVIYSKTMNWIRRYFTGMVHHISYTKYRKSHVFETSIDLVLVSFCFTFFPFFLRLADCSHYFQLPISDPDKGNNPFQNASFSLFSPIQTNFRILVIIVINLRKMVGLARSTNFSCFYEMEDPQKTYKTRFYLETHKFSAIFLIFKRWI